MMNWQQLLSPARLGSRHSSVGTFGRSDFHKDYDRIIFSAAFRRLQRKTQVHPLPENDNVHTRLTHSLEVSCVARSLGLMVGNRLHEKGSLPDAIEPDHMAAIVQAAALCHDIGNPPFGHAGEYAIRQWFVDANPKFTEGLTEAQFADLTTYEGNAQGFRLLTNKRTGLYDGGMRLTYATLASFLKYPWSAAGSPFPQKKKFGAFQKEFGLLEEVADATGLIRIGDQAFCRHPLVYLVEAADDVCYALIDIEDGVELELVDFAILEKMLLPCITDDLPVEYDREPNVSRKISFLRGKIIAGVLDALVDAFVANEESLLAGEWKGDLLACAKGPFNDLIAQAKSFSEKQIILNRRKVQIEVGAFAHLETLLETFCKTALDVHHAQSEADISYRTGRVRELIGNDAMPIGASLYDLYLVILDYVSGMTDDFAARLARDIGGGQH
ncbi:MAG: deoxyguanosinetriphosphate triphosphohydrolase [Thalassospira sp.]|uniref:deoxyguanosinetriphosphate triphosphohydrolase n=1 Tax=Thalassospira sp. TaxID=1912094 RepID=UPI001B20DD3E|nr:deoxyguanosinetriphosphate triphosphohydrolase [Thalassospira sp.]MBO6579904.1 deoxyguanosinetriphosphate triphosphohydrolase [Thalassospira sp.]MBO6803391.1 deoxyguanosinetriphosphate triphosphohydrolase [Thalassospira sp.]MBO6818277.1 deoxyguanosinetriphosphate triphosphohydrolase [Thalassospira sp.]MBO6889336.1 deoxyguanosinetriphosphate triphosphohydrolase [Thalassospira sp.]